MAVAHGLVAESHTGTTGSASEASFDTLVNFTNAKGLLVYTFVNANADDALSVKIDPAGANIDVPAVTGGRAVDTAGEAGDCKAWFLGSGLPTGSPVTVRVNRTNNANVMYAQFITQTALTDTEVTGVLLEQEDQALTEENINDGSPGTNSVRYMGINSGRAQLADIPAGANSTANAGIDFGARLAQTYRETTAGQGSRPVGADTATAVDDVAAVYLAIREVVAGGTTVTPAVIAVTASLPTPGILAASTVTPAAVAAVAALPTPSILAAALVAPSVIPIGAALPTPTIVVEGGPTTVTPATISILAALPTPLILAAAKVTPATIVISVTLPTSVASAGATVLPAVIGLVIALPTPTILAASTVTPATITVLAGFPTPLILVPGLVTPATIGLIVALPTPLIIVAVPTFWQFAPVAYTLNPAAYIPVRAGDDPPW